MSEVGSLNGVQRQPYANINATFSSVWLSNVTKDQSGQRNPR